MSFIALFITTFKRILMVYYYILDRNNNVLMLCLPVGQSYSSDYY